MSFNRTRYDACAYDLEIARSTEQGNYRLQPHAAERCDQCVSMTGPIGSKSDVSTAKKPMDLAWGEMADAESILSWRGRNLSKCNDPLSKLSTQLHHKPVCTNKLTPEDTRFTHPIDDYRSMSLTSYMVSPYLPVNPQCVIQEDRTGFDTRLFSKDSYRMPKQEPWDNGSALPKPRMDVEQKGRWVFVLDEPIITQTN